MAQQSRLLAFIEAFRRRRVFRVAAFYGGVAFVIVQIINGAPADFMMWRNPYLREAYNFQVKHFYSPDTHLKGILYEP